MDWELLQEVMNGADQVSDQELVKDNQTGSVIGGGVALAAGVAMGITSLPLAVPLIVVGGALGGAAGCCRRKRNKSHWKSSNRVLW